MINARRVAIITGGATGVGAACSEWFAARGFDVLIVYRTSRSKAEALAHRCMEAGGRLELVQADISADADCRRLGDFVARTWGRADVLVNSAGATLFRAMADLEQLNSKDFLDVYTVNVVGPYQLVRAMETLLRTSSGAVVNISSLAGQNGTGSSYAYAASKGALNTLTLALARNLAPDVRVNAVLPSLIDSDWVRKGVGEEAWSGVRTSFEAQAALGRISSPADIAAAVGWIATAAPTVTGQLIVVDGGVTLGRQPVVTKR